MTQTTATAAQTGSHFAVAHLGRLAELGQYAFDVPALGCKIPGKVFLKEALGLTGVEISWNSFPAGGGIAFLHAHREHEEIYLFVAGQGEFVVDGEVFAIGEGSVVRVAPAGVRAYRNTGETPLTFIVLQVKAGSLAAGTIEDGLLVQGALPWQA